ncbi:MAG TPA: hypothetical protein VHC94_11650 [Nitrobacter sp.]|nr:hypothetical protein [Nitrobacter sp.]
MVLKSSAALVVCLVGMAGSGVCHAAGYQPGQFFNLDIAHAALSPNPLGPPAHFEQIPVEANTAPDDRTVPDAKVTQVRPVHIRPHSRVQATRRTIPRRTLARRSRRNPLDAQAADTRIQVWPCRSGGICNWQRPAGRR